MNDTAVNMQSKLPGRERLATLALAIVMTIALPIAIDQGYFRYNAYVLPWLGLTACLLYLAFVLTMPVVIRFLKTRIERDRITAIVLVVVMAAAIGFGLFSEFGKILSMSKLHVAAALKADSKPENTVVLKSEPKTTLVEKPSEVAASNKPIDPPKARPAKQSVKPLAPQPPATTPAHQTPSAAPTQTVNVDHGIGGIGGTYVNPTVNNFAPPSRHILETQKTEFIGCLSKHPGSVNIMSVNGDPEAYALAGDWLEVFRAAKWSIDNDKVMQFMFGGGMWTGSQINFSGSIKADGTDSKYDHTSAGGALADCLIGKQIGLPSDGSGKLVPYPDMAPDHVAVIVGPRPTT
jgi:hypothetical protein